MKQTFPVVILLLWACACSRENPTESKPVEEKTPVEVKDDNNSKVLEQSKSLQEPKTGEKPLLKTDAFDLDGVSALVRTGKVKDGEALTKTINDPKRSLNKVDIDGDGRIDVIQIVEVREGPSRVFEFHAIPSSQPDEKSGVIIARMVFTPQESSGNVVVVARYTPVVEHHDVYISQYVIVASIHGTTIVAEDNPFITWVFIHERPTFFYVNVHPGYNIHIFSVEPHYHDYCWPPGHCKQGKFGKHYYNDHGGNWGGGKKQKKWK